MGEQYIGLPKREELQRRMAALGIHPDRLVEKFIAGSGSGGQKINKTSSCVYLCDPASGIEVKCQRTRYRELNRFLARRELCDILEERRGLAISKRRSEQERVRRQKRRRSRRQKAKMLDDKRHHGGIKAARRAPGDE